MKVTPTLQSILDAIAAIKPLPEPFNGATSILLSTSAADAILPHMHVAFPVEAPTIHVSPLLPDGYGAGFRAWKQGDDPKLQNLGTVLVWLLNPKKATDA